MESIYDGRIIGIVENEKIKKKLDDLNIVYRVVKLKFLEEM